MRYSESNQSTEPRFHSFMYVSYIDPANYPKLFEGITNYAFIKHDNPADLLREDGTSKEEHWHILVYYKNARTLSSCLNKCIRYKEKLGQTVLVERAYDTYKAFLYLTHTDPDSHTKNKYVYSEELITSYDISWWNSLSQANGSCFTTQQFILDLFRLNKLQMALTYGRDYIRNMGVYHTFRDELLAIYNGDIGQIEEEINGVSPKPLFELTSDVELGDINNG